MELKEKFIAVVGLAISLWIIIPIPELSIIFGLVSGHTVTSVFNLPWWYTWVFVILTIPVGIFLERTGLMDRIKRFFGLKEDKLTVGD